jgi:hypothetical protein
MQHQIRVTILKAIKTSGKNSRNLEKELLQAKEKEKALKRQLHEVNAKNEAAERSSMRSSMQPW